MNRIRSLREELGLSQIDLAQLLQCHNGTVSKYELEKIPLTDDILKKLSRIFDVSVDYILGLTSQRSVAGTSFARSKVILELAAGNETLLKTLRTLSPESKKKVIEYIDLLHDAEQIKKR